MEQGAGGIFGASIEEITLDLHFLVGDARLILFKHRTGHCGLLTTYNLAIFQFFLSN